uniref:Uncharacterized protein n=1 Tax=Anopheles christyi TaxID=43041 RepID=A0A182KGF5_9DIPT
MQRPSPSTNSIAPMTPVAQRNSITAPQPVDCAKQREMEVHKINTLQLMLDQVKKNRDNLIASNKPHVEVARADATIQKLEKELQQMLGEPGSYPAFSPSSLSSPPLFPQPQAPNSVQTTSTTPAFLSRFPRSLSSLSLGTKKKSSDAKEMCSPTAATLFSSPECLSPTDGGGPFGGLTSSGSSAGTPTKTKKYSASSAADHHHHHHLHGGGNHHGHHMNRSGHFGGKHQQSADIPPPLPQRNNIPKKSDDTVDMMLVGSRRNILVSDLDHLVLSPTAQETSSLHSAGSTGSTSSKAGGGGGGSGKSSRSKKKNGSSTTHNNSVTSNNNNNNNNNNSSSSGKNTSNNLITSLDSPTVDGNVLATATSTTELQAEPPPLPPRQPGMLEVVNQNL